LRETKNIMKTLKQTMNTEKNVEKKTNNENVEKQ
jgi:hypothetical protein